MKNVQLLTFAKLQKNQEMISKLSHAHLLRMARNIPMRKKNVISYYSIKCTLTLWSWTMKWKNKNR